MIPSCYRFHIQLRTDPKLNVSCWDRVDIETTAFVFRSPVQALTTYQTISTTRLRGDTDAQAAELVAAFPLYLAAHADELDAACRTHDLMRGYSDSYTYDDWVKGQAERVARRDVFRILSQPGSEQEDLLSHFLLEGKSLIEAVELTRALSEVAA